MIKANIKSPLRDFKKRVFTYKMGMRTIKTALAVFVCLIAYVAAEHYWEFVSNYDSFLAMIAAVICMQDSVKNSIKVGGSRLAGTLIGAVLGMCILYIERVWPYQVINVLLLAISTMIIIVFCNIFNINQAIVIGCVVFFVIALQTTGSMDPFESAARRFFDTMIGVIIAVGINHLVFNPDKDDDDDT